MAKFMGLALERSEGMKTFILIFMRTGFLRKPVDEEELLALDGLANEMTFRIWEDTGYDILAMIAPTSSRSVTDGMLSNQAIVWHEN